MKLLAYAHSAVVTANQGQLAALAARGVEVELVVPQAWKGDLHGTWLHPGIHPGLEGRVHPVPVRWAGQVPLHTWKEDLAGRVQRFRPDAIYVEHESYALATAQVARAAGDRPLICRNNQNLLKALPFPFAQLEGYVFRKLGSLGVVNEAAGGVARAKGYQGRIDYLPYTLDPARYQGGPREALRQAWGLEGLIVGYVGRLVEEKGLWELVAAMEALPPGQASLVLLGRGPLEADLARRLQGWGPRRGLWLPAVAHEEVPALLQALDLLALPSRSTPGWVEQFGRVLIEAAAAGVPALGSDSGEIPHLIRRLGVGMSVPEGQSEALRAALAELLAQPERLALWQAEAPRVVQAEYSHEAGARRLEALVAALAGSAGRA